MLNFLQRIGKSLMLPIAVLPAAALLLRLGQDDLLGIPFIAAAGDAIFANLALIFAIGIAIGFSKDGNGVAGLAGAIGYFVLTEGAMALNEEINMGVLGGILTGVIAGLLYNRFHAVKLPDWLAFFGGRRFVPIVTAATMVILAGLFGVIWPTIQEGINAVGEWIIGAGALGAGVYGFLNRLLIPIGLHHVLNSLVWFVFGEYEGATGDLNRFFAGDPSAGIFMAGFFPVMMFGLPAAALAMIVTAKTKRRKATAGILLGIAFTSFLTGITEPIEYSFMFLSPLLYVVHALLTASSMMVAYALDIRHGFGFSAGAIDFFLNLSLATRPWLLFGIGLIYGAVYFVIFYFLIKLLDLKTPGREDEDLEEDAPESRGEVAAGGDKYETMAANFIEDLGGKQNINTIDNCATRLRLTIENMDEIKEKDIKKHGANGIMKVNRSNLQIIVGTNVEFVADAMKRQVGEKDGPALTEQTAERRENGPEGELKGSEFVLPINGRVIPLADVPDQAFSEKMMGDGFAIDPIGNMVVAPVDGKIETIFPTKHAIGLKTENGYEILIHVGLDTVKLNGEGFDVLVNAGDKVKKGQKLMSFDLDKIKREVPSVITPVVFTNLNERQQVLLKKEGELSQGTEGVIEVK